MPRTPSVLIVQTIVPDFRQPLFREMEASLADAGVRLRVAHGMEPGPGAHRPTRLAAPLGLTLRNRWLFGRRVLLQPVGAAIRAADLVVIEHANRHLPTIVRTLASGRRRPLVAFWGHGRNRQAANPTAWTERLKATTVRWADWWFAYTDGSVRHLEELGVARNRITVVPNTIDTRSLADAVRTCSTDERAAWRKRNGIPPDATLGLFCGSLYREKDLPMLLNAAAQVRAEVERFHLVIGGDGPERPQVEAAARAAPWIHYVGPLAGQDKATAFRDAEVLLNPGLVGLAIVDGFAAGLPFLTTHRDVHSPEIEYLEDDVNGRCTAASADAFARAVVALLRDDETRARLAAGARASADRVALPDSARRFTDGIVACLRQGGRLS